MRALTLRQPWATLVFDTSYGPKDVENRSWSTSYRGPLLIHAGSGVDQEAPDPSPEAHNLFGRQAGAILGVVDLVDVHRDCSPRCSPWAHDGGYHWVLRDPRLFTRSVPCSGALQVWNSRRLLPIVEQEIEHQMALIGVRA